MYSSGSLADDSVMHKNNLGIRKDKKLIVYIIQQFFEDGFNPKLFGHI
jgi:hypothetical protein